MAKQTEAQRLADEIGDLANEAELHYYTGNVREAAALLRRQDELLGQALEALDNMTDAQSNPARRNFPTIHDYGKSRRAADAIRAHLEAK